MHRLLDKIKYVNVCIHSETHPPKNERVGTHTTHAAPTPINQTPTQPKPSACNDQRPTHVVVLLLPELALRLVVHQRPEHGGVRGEHVPVRLQVLLADAAEAGVSTCAMGWDENGGGWVSDQSVSQSG